MNEPTRHERLLQDNFDLKEEVDRLFLENEKLKEAVAMFMHQPCLPDDAEPITAKWWCEEVPGVEFIDISTVDTRFNIGCDKDGVFFSIIDCRSGYQDVISIPAVRTRGDVRQLVRLLGRE